MSGGRVEMGSEPAGTSGEHAELGIPYPDRSSGWTDWRSSSRSCAASGTSPTAGTSRVSTTRSATRSSARRASDPTSSSVATASRARCASRRPTPTSTTSARRPPTRSRDDQRATSTRPARRSGATRPASRDRSWPARSSGATRRTSRGVSTPRWRSSANARPMGRPGSTHVATAGSSGTPDLAARPHRGLPASPACERLLYQVLPAARPRARARCSASWRASRAQRTRPARRGGQ